MANDSVDIVDLPIISGATTMQVSENNADETTSEESEHGVDETELSTTTLSSAHEEDRPSHLIPIHINGNKHNNKHLIRKGIKSIASNVLRKNDHKPDVSDYEKVDQLP